MQKLSYELAKELKDAGFPQKIWGQYIDEYGAVIRDGGGQLGTGNDWCYLPTLSELIEACGESFNHLWRREDKWFANKEATIGIEGSTPEEAVARLWLALNKK